MKKYVPFLIPAFFFLFLKLTSLGVRFSDTNIYFYTAYQILQGKLLYKDVFFTNFPLFIYISSLYQIFSGGNIYFYYFTASLECVITSLFIYLIVMREVKRPLIAGLSSSIYLFSYLVLSTSDHQSGVFLSSLFATMSYYFFQRKKFLLTGIFLACALLTKAYFLPVFLAFLFVLPTKPFSFQNKSFRFFLGFGVTVLLILLPSLLFSFPAFYKDIITYSLIRPQGVSKALIFNALLTREFLLLGLSAISIILIKKYRFFGILSLCMLLLFLFYKDFYFYYANIAAPFLCIFFGLLYEKAEQLFQLQKAVIPTFVGIVLCINLIQYFNTTRDQKIDNFSEIVQAAKDLHRPVIYGTNDIAPLIAYETKLPLLNNIVDTNPTIFRKGFLSSTILTNEALQKKALLIGHGVEYPEYDVKQNFIDEIFDAKQLQTCQMTNNFPVITEGYINRLQFVICP